MSDLTLYIVSIINHLCTIIYINYSYLNKHIYTPTLDSILFLQYRLFYRAPLKKHVLVL